MSQKDQSKEAQVAALLKKQSEFDAQINQLAKDIEGAGAMREKYLEDHPDAEKGDPLYKLLQETYDELQERNVQLISQSEMIQKEMDALLARCSTG
jgi:uncharacterized membrane protein YccC